MTRKAKLHNAVTCRWCRRHAAHGSLRGLKREISKLERREGKNEIIKEIE